MNPPSAASGGRLELIPLDEGRWRLSDRRAPRSDAAHVVAYIERSGSGLDVVWLRGGTLPTTFRRFDQILALALTLVTEGDTRGSSRPVPIPSRSPVRH